MFKIYSFRISFMYIIQMKQCCFHGFLWLVNLKKIRIGTNGASNIGFDQNFKVKPPRQTSCMLHQVLKGEDGGCLFILKLFQMFSPSWSHSNSSSPHLPSPLFLRGCLPVHSPPTSSPLSWGIEFLQDQRHPFPLWQDKAVQEAFSKEKMPSSESLMSPKALSVCSLHLALGVPKRQAWIGLQL